MVAWFNNNIKFFDMTQSLKNNVIETQFESGKTRTYLKNSSPIKTYSVSFLLWTKQEEIDFLTWYESTLKSRAETFSYADLVTHTTMTEYRMTTEPKISNSQYPKKCDLEIEEA